MFCFHTVSLVLLMMAALFACGSNGSGQLALGHEDDVSVFTKCQFDPSCSDFTEIHDLVSAASHSLLLVKDGDQTKLLGAGTNTHGQLGLQCALSETQKAATTFRPVSIGRDAGLSADWRPVKVAATWTTSFVVFTDSEREVIVACGSNDFGELSVPPSSTLGPVNVDVGMRPGEYVEHLRGGQRHVIVVISKGAGSERTQRIVGWGASRRGELSAIPIDASAKGKGKARPSTMGPTEILLDIPTGVHIVDLSLGASHSLALLSDGHVLAWGSNAKGQTTGVSELANIRQACATWGGSYFRDESRIWSQGSNTHSQLLRAADTPDRGPVRLDASPSSLCAGTEHVLVLASNGDPSLYSGGWNEHGNLALGDVDDRPRLVKVDISGRPENMWAGCAASWVWIGL